jgi:hypothetical protein
MTDITSPAVLFLAATVPSSMLSRARFSWVRAADEDVSAPARRAGSLAITEQATGAAVATPRRRSRNAVASKPRAEGRARLHMVDGVLPEKLADRRRREGWRKLRTDGLDGSVNLEDGEGHVYGR